MKRLIAVIAVLCIACAPHAPSSLRPRIPTVTQLIIPVVPECNWGGLSTWTFTPTVGKVPLEAWYTVIDTISGPHEAIKLIAGQQVTITLANGTTGPWQVYILTPDNDWAPVSGIIVNPAPICV